jgi:hypothetical protein
MPTRLPAGPYRTVTLNDGVSVPFYVIPFDKVGVCEAPETRRRLVESVAQGVYTDVFVFSHGWNTDWQSAIQVYERFLAGFMQLRRTYNLKVPGAYRPVLVGIFWPSAALVFGEAEVGPVMSSVAPMGVEADPSASDWAVNIEHQALRDLAQQLKRSQVQRFYELMQKESLDPQESLELAKIVRVFYRTVDDETHQSKRLSATKIVQQWQDVERDEAAQTTPGVAPAGAQAIEFGQLAQRLDPRNALRVLTIYQMKDRAGVVGGFGVGPLLRELLEVKDLKLHLIGHSFGCKVMLAAVATGGPFPKQRQVDSLLLLQPAVSHLCFADKIDKVNRPGAYRVVLERVRKPILSTFSTQDTPLYRLFHLALRRDKDRGEAPPDVSFAPMPGDFPDPPNDFAALGGYGPRRAGETLIQIKRVKEPYDLKGTVPIYGVDGTGVITSHGDISNEATWWALYSLLTAERA